MTLLLLVFSIFFFQVIYMQSYENNYREIYGRAMSKNNRNLSTKSTTNCSLGKAPQCQEQNEKNLMDVI